MVHDLSEMFVNFYVHIKDHRIQSKFYDLKRSKKLYGN
jgi:hypothetical protein